MNKEIINKMKEEIKEIFKEGIDLDKLNDLKVEYLGKSGKITELSKMMKEIPNEEKKEFGKALNEIRDEFTKLYEDIKNKLETEAINEKLAEEKIDITMPATEIKNGAPNILE